MESRIIEIVAEVCWLSPNDIARDVDLGEYGLDSARAIDLVVALEDAFGVEISDDVAAQLRTVADIVERLAAVRKGLAEAA